MAGEFRILSPTAILGYGFPLASFRRGMELKPHCIAVDAGSTDPGPYYLGSGKSFTDRAAVKRDLEIMIPAGIEQNIPVCIGTAGGSGARPHLDWCLDIVREIAAEQKLHFKLAVIPADIDRQMLVSELKKGRVRPLEPVPELTEDDIARSMNIVAQMGMEPFVKALDMGAQVILAGRAYDPAVFACAPVRAGFDKALAIHMGKILECAAIASTPGSGSDCMFGTLYDDCFTVHTLNDDRVCTTLSVAAHTLYEKTDPTLLPGPGGRLNLKDVTFDEIEPGVVRVAGSRFEPTEGYQLKLEGAKPLGFRTVSIAGVRDPVMISQMDEVIEGVRKRVDDNLASLRGKYRLSFIQYGRNGVMGALEPVQTTGSHELGIVIEAVAEDQQTADAICSLARSTMLHFGYKGRRATAGNLAFPYSPSDFKAGQVFGFSIYHLLEVEDPAACFPVEITEL